MNILILIIALVIVAAITGSLLLVRTRRGGPPPGPQRERPGPAGLAGPATQDATGTATAPPGVETVAEPARAPAEPAPPPSAGRLVRLRGRLARSQSAFGSVLLSLLARDGLDDQTWEEIEDTLITADMGVTPARELVERLRTEVKVTGSRGADDVRALLRAQLITAIGPDLDRSLHAARHGDRPAVLLVVGVNGTGKTTTCGKLARVLVGDGRTVLLGAADTFRAAAADQLETWGTRVGARTVRADREGADPASVAFEAVKQGIGLGVDAVIVDTAGRLHTKTNLMEELRKVKRIIEKQLPGAPDEILLILDATTGQNGLQQAKVFTEVAEVTDVAVAKLDGTAKGGIVFAIARELKLPIRFSATAKSSPALPGLKRDQSFKPCLF